MVTFIQIEFLFCINTISSKGRIRQILFLLCVRIWFLRGAKQSGAALINETSTNSKNGICRILPLLLSEARIELRNLQFLKKMLEKSSQFWSLDQPNKPKSLDVALNIAGVEKYTRKTCDCRQPGGHSIQVLNGKERK